MASICPPMRLGVTAPIWRDRDASTYRDVLSKPGVFLSEDFKDLVIVARQNDKSEPVVIKKIPLRLRFEANVQAEVENLENLRRFRYRVDIEKASQDPVTSISIVVSPSLERTSVSYSGRGHDPGWIGGVSLSQIAGQSEINSPLLGVFASWTVRGQNPLVPSVAPGTGQDGFEIRTKLLPGFTTIYLGGLQWQGSDPILDEVDVVTGSSQATFPALYVPLLTMGPMFRPTDPCYMIVKNYVLGLESLSRCPNVRVSQHFVDQVSLALRSKDACPALSSAAPLARLVPATDFEKTILDAIGILREQLTTREGAANSRNR